MTIQTINLGNYANDGTGDDLRTAFQKVNANFTFLGATSGIIDGANLGSGTGVFAQKNTTDPILEFKSLTSLDNSITITHTATTVNLKSSPNIVDDTSPQLGGNLDLQDYYIYHGDVQTTVFGIDIRSTNALIELMIASNSVTLDFGTFLEPTGSNGNPGDRGINLDFNGLLLNGFAGTPGVGNVNLGNFV